ncbi:transketolase/ N-terminal domain-like protein [Synechococcus sp. PROS-7-1]|uniref:transketolase n=1 Tax=Synechococcus sp. PROS-7-1 TaxID=1442556 RepID=UPI001648BC69|nr:transketolase [Synechococcus sp. PROS-7-1]QNI84124.1 transketolase/ N-terminal domain-like protein [Synechococcus sp. PROS-7-1]
MDSLTLSKKIRLQALNMCSKGKSSHIGSILSCADILAVLYSNFINYDVVNPKSQSRDRFVMSKGHAGAGLYATLACLGFVDTSILNTHYQNGSYLSGHVCHKLFPGIEVSTGSLGHGLPISCGIAQALKLQKSDSNVYVLMSDGELDEGSNWEAFLYSSHHRLDNLYVFIDRNFLQSIESTEETLALEPLTSKFESFGWYVATLDGHSHEDLSVNIQKSALIKDKPKIFICNTIKGKGVDFMENKVLWHYRSPSANELSLATDLLS